MEIKANTPSLDAESRRLMDHLFYQRIVTLENLNGNRLKLSKQLQINKLRERMEMFIREHRYSFFEVSVLEDIENIDMPKHSIKVRNFPNYKGQVTPNSYLMAIEPSWTNCRIFQLSPTGLKMEEILI